MRSRIASIQSRLVSVRCCNQYLIFLLCAIAMLIFDTPYGVGRADWDAEPLPPEDLATIFKQFEAVNQAPVSTAVVWADWTVLPSYKPVFQNSCFKKEIHPVYWHKDNQNTEGAPDRHTFAVENFLMGRMKCNDRALDPCTLDFNPMMRHNHITGHTLSTYRKNADGQKINIHEKPTYLARELATLFCSPGDWVIVCGAGAGGEVFGCIEAGCNVVAIEQDEVQVQALCANLLTYDAEQALKAEREQTKLASKRTLKGDPKARKLIANACPSCGCAQEGVERGDCGMCDQALCATCGLASDDGKCLLCGPACVQRYNLEHGEKDAGGSEEEAEAAFDKPIK